MHSPAKPRATLAVSVHRLGQEGEPLVVIDGFAADPDALRESAKDAAFAPADRFYPGIRAPVPPGYIASQMPIVDEVIAKVFGGRPTLLDAAYSIVTTPPEALKLPQRLPHCDAFTRDRIAMIHYLSPADIAGTAFYRHRTTGFETITEARRPSYSGRLTAEIDSRGAPQGYLIGSTPLFEQIAAVEARYNRALLYRSCLLHSGLIPADAALSADPSLGRLTVTAFLSTR